MNQFFSIQFGAVESINTLFIVENSFRVRGNFYPPCTCLFDDYQICISEIPRVQTLVLGNQILNSGIKYF